MLNDSSENLELDTHLPIVFRLDDNLGDLTKIHYLVQPFLGI